MTLRQCAWLSNNGNPCPYLEHEGPYGIPNLPLCALHFGKVEQHMIGVWRESHPVVFPKVRTPSIRTTEGCFVYRAWCNCHEKIAYVGQTTNLDNRMKEQAKRFERIQIQVVNREDDLRYVESFLIAKYDPPHNLARYAIHIGADFEEPSEDAWSEYVVATEV